MSRTKLTSKKFLVKVESEAVEHGGFLLLPALENLSISGKYVVGPRTEVDLEDAEVLFMYTAHSEGTWVTDDILAIPEDMIYAVGNSMLHDWCLVHMDEAPVCTIVQSNIHPTGLEVLIDPKRAHRLVPQAYSDTPIFLVKENAVLMLGK